MAKGGPTQRSAPEAADLRAGIEAVPSGVAIFGPDGRLTFFNQRFREVTAPTVRPVLRLGQRFEDILAAAGALGPIYHPEMGEGFVERRLERHRAAQADHEIRLADGRWLHLRESALPDGGRVIVATDVSDRKRAEAADRLLRAVIDAVPGVIHLKDRELRYQLANRYYLERWALAEADLIGKTQKEAFSQRLAFAWSRATDDRDARVLATGEPTGFYEVSVPVEGERDMVLWANKIPIRDEQGEVSHVLTVGTDVTRLQEAQEEIARQREALHQSEKLNALGSMLASIAHELNNPLSVVLGYATMMDDLASDPVSKERAQRVRAAAERCARIVRTFLAMARSKPQQRAPVQLSRVVEAALEVSDYGLKSADVEVTLDLAPDLPEITGDGDQLALVVMNLLVNAQQVLQSQPPPRQVRITTRATAAGALIRVEDNGPGVPAAAREQIFEPFFTTKPAGAGTGIGLSVCRGIALAHGGRIEVEEAAGGGSAFVVHLPRGGPAQPAPLEAGAPPALGSARILVVDDEPELRQLLVEILERRGFAVETAASGREALAVLAARPLDLIISDLRMPDLDGPGLYRTLARERPELVSRLLFITGASLAEDVMLFLAETGADVIEKPFDPQEVVRRVQRRLDAAADRP
jgi:signal transduction histidine kinase/ActR/RegA family two-component response regulator